MLGGNFGLKCSHAADSCFMNMNFSQASSVDKVRASVTSRLPALNYTKLIFYKGVYTNITSGDETNGTFGDNTDWTLLW